MLNLVKLTWTYLNRNVEVPIPSPRFSGHWGLNKLKTASPTSVGEEEADKGAERNPLSSKVKVEKFGDPVDKVSIEVYRFWSDTTAIL